MELTTIFNTRRSIRSFTGEAVSEETMQHILHAANASPVGLAKYESVHLTVVKSKEMLAALEQNAAQILKMENRSFLYGAPELVIVSTADTNNVGYSNAAIIAHDMSLAAVNDGVGVCHIWGCMAALAANPELVAKLGIPAGFTPTCAVAIGQTNEVYSAREIPADRIAMNVI